MIFRLFGVRRTHGGGEGCGGRLIGILLMVIVSLVLAYLVLNGVPLQP